MAAHGGCSPASPRSSWCSSPRRRARPIHGAMVARRPAPDGAARPGEHIADRARPDAAASLARARSPPRAATHRRWPSAGTSATTPRTAPRSLAARAVLPPRGFHSWSVGENLLWGAPDVGALRAFKLWLNSPPHRANLLSPRWREIGIGATHSTVPPACTAADRPRSSPPTSARAAGSALHPRYPLRPGRL